MTKKVAFTSVALAAGIAVIAYAQDPRFDTESLAPYLQSGAKPALNVAGVGSLASSPRTISVSAGTAASESDDQVSVVFTNAKAEEITDWLSKNGFKVVIPTQQFDSKSTSSITLKNVPRERLLDVIASAMGGKWEDINGVKTFRKSSYSEIALAPAIADVVAMVPHVALKALPALPLAAIKPDMTPVQAEKFGKDMSEWAEKFAAEFGTKFGPQFQQRWAEFGEKFGKEFGKEFGSQFEKDWNSPEAKASLEKMSKDLEKQFNSPEAQAKWKAFGDKMEREWNSPEAKARLEKMVKDMEKQFNSPEAQAKWKAFSDKMEREWNSPEAKARLEKLGKEMELKGKLMEREARAIEIDGRNSDRIARVTTGEMDLKSLAKTLSPAQREKHRRQGYLRFEDLTPSQQRFLGKMSSTGNWTVQYSVNGEQLTIKSDRD